jgi:hypothetical protein
VLGFAPTVKVKLFLSVGRVNHGISLRGVIRSYGVVTLIEVGEEGLDAGSSGGEVSRGGKDYSPDSLRYSVPIASYGEGLDSGCSRAGVRKRQSPILNVFVKDFLHDDRNISDFPEPGGICKRFKRTDIVDLGCSGEIALKLALASKDIPIVGGIASFPNSRRIYLWKTRGPGEIVRQYRRQEC